MRPPIPGRLSVSRGGGARGSKVMGVRRVGPDSGKSADRIAAMPPPCIKTVREIRVWRNGMEAGVFDRLHEWLQQKGVSFTVLRHEPVFTSEQAAAVRGTSLSSGAKALVMK